jgi:hypothetical protein
VAYAHAAHTHTHLACRRTPPCWRARWCQAATLCRRGTGGQSSTGRRMWIPPVTACLRHRARTAAWCRQLTMCLRAHGTQAPAEAAGRRGGEAHAGGVVALRRTEQRGQPAARQAHTQCAPAGQMVQGSSDVAPPPYPARHAHCLLLTAPGAAIWPTGHACVTAMHRASLSAPALLVVPKGPAGTQSHADATQATRAHRDARTHTSTAVCSSRHCCRHAHGWQSRLLLPALQVPTAHSRHWPVSGTMPYPGRHLQAVCVGARACACVTACAAGC